MQNKTELDDCKYVIKQKEFKISELETSLLELKEALNKRPEEGGRGIDMSGALNSNPINPANARPALGEPSEARVWAEEL